MPETTASAPESTPAPVIVTTPPTMSAALCRRYGSAADVVVEDVPVPAVTDDGVLVKVESASLNALDHHFLTGTPYFLRLTAGLRRPKQPILGADVAGVVVAVGAGVTRFAVGDRVFGETKAGTAAGFVVVHHGALGHLPASVSFDDGAATGVAGLTALQALTTHAAVQPGERVLVNGAAGGVGTFLVQLAAHLGAEVTAVCSTRNVDMVRRLGASTVIDYTVDDFADTDEPYDVMIDNVGNRTPATCSSVLTDDGRYVVLTGPKANPWIDPMAFILRAHLHFRRRSQSLHQFTADPNPADLQRLADLLERGAIVPEIDRVVGLDGVAAGLAEIATGHTRAKIVVHPR